MFLEYLKIPLSCENTSSLGKRLPSSHARSTVSVFLRHRILPLLGTNTSFGFYTGLYSKHFIQFYIIETNADSVQCYTLNSLCLSNLAGHRQRSFLWYLSAQAENSTTVFIKSK